jgi:regulator of G-protein signaling
MANPLFKSEDSVHPPELESLAATLGDPEALRYFRLFLMKEMNIENLTFYEEASKFISNIRNSSDHIYHKYIKDGAAKQVNISASQRLAIESKIKVPGAYTFLDAEKEIWLVMRKDPYPRFVKSDFVKKWNAKSHLQM